MPINLFNNPLASIKLGANNILKGYIGNGQIFPNDAEITAAAFDNANIVNTGGNTPYSVSGEIGASFTLTGSSGATAPSGTQVISTSPTTYQIAIGDQSTTCDAAQRNPQVIITPQGNTTLATGLSNTDTIIQAAGPSTIPNNIGLSISATNTSYQTQNIGGVLKWITGATWSVTINYTVGSAGQNAVNYVFGTGASQSGIGYTISNIVPSAGFSNTTQVQYDPSQPPSRSFSASWTLQSGAAQYVSFGSLISNNTGACYSASPGSITTGNLFP
jgi:hypothetical protein